MQEVSTTFDSICFSDQVLDGDIPFGVPCLPATEVPDVDSYFTWQEREWLKPSSFICDLPLSEAQRYDMGFFSKSLRTNQIIDNELALVPGGLTVFPRGVALIEKFAAELRQRAASAGFLEFDYPLLWSELLLAPFNNLFSTAQRVLCAGSGSCAQTVGSRWVLNPSGEGITFSHWKNLLKQGWQLPISSFRRARYFRPGKSGKHSGRTVFNSVESGDVFEFFAGAADAESAHRRLQALIEIINATLKSWSIPIIWSIRPPWSNNFELFEWSIGGDVLLPIGRSIQVATGYSLGQKISEQYDLRAPHSGTLASLASGSLSRRLILVHLFFGMREDGSIVHDPKWSDTKVVVLRHIDAKISTQRMREFQAELSALGIANIEFDNLESEELSRERTRLRRDSTPIIIQIPRGSSRCILSRSDSHLIAEFEFDSGSSTSIQKLLRDMSAEFKLRAQRSLAARFVSAATEEEALAALRAGMLVSMPCCTTKACATKVASWKCGEMLGWTQSNTEQRCAISGKVSDTSAILARRV